MKFDGFKIGSVRLPNITVLAPLAGITNLPFRHMAKQVGCGLVCSEMISSNGLVHDSKKTFQLLDTVPEEKPLSMQIFGANPSIMAEAAAAVESNGADILDINFGCSVKKIIKTGSGVALMKDPDKAEAVLTAVRKAVEIPMTIKIRSGWEASGSQAVKIAHIAESCGVDAISVHPRTANQGFSGRADWSVISKVKAQVSIPIIGNGDIVSPETAEAMLNQTGCDAVMIGRAAIGNPWIFLQLMARFRETPAPEIDLETHFDMIRKYVTASVNYFGETHGCRMMRSRLCWFVKGLPHSSKFRESIKRISTINEAIEKIDGYYDSLQNRSRHPGVIYETVNIDEPVKSPKTDGKVKSAKFKACESRVTRRTYSTSQ